MNTNADILARIFNRVPSDATPDFRSANSWTRGIDLSCIATQAVTAVSPRFVVQAAHYATNGPTGFIARDGVQVSRTITQYPIPGTDISVGRLDSPLPSTVAPARIARPEMLTRGALLLATNQDKGAFVSWVSGTDASNIYVGTDYPHPWIVPWMPSVRSGNSGSPLGLVIDDEFVLVTLYHSSGDGPHYPALIGKVNDAIRALGGAENELAELWQPYDAGDVNRDGMTDAFDANMLSPSWQHRTRLRR